MAMKTVTLKFVVSEDESSALDKEISHCLDNSGLQDFYLLDWSVDDSTIAEVNKYEADKKDEEIAEEEGLHINLEDLIHYCERNIEYYQKNMSFYTEDQEEMKQNLSFYENKLKELESRLVTENKKENK